MTGKRGRVHKSVTIELRIKAPDEETAKRILEHPALRNLVAAFEGKHMLGGQDEEEKKDKPYADYQVLEFLDCPQLRGRAVKWLVEQLMLPDNHMEKIVIGKLDKAEDLDVEHIAKNLFSLSHAYSTLIQTAEKRGLLMAAGGYHTLNNPELAEECVTKILGLTEQAKGKIIESMDDLKEIKYMTKDEVETERNKRIKTVALLEAQKFAGLKVPDGESPTPY